jgi:branched-chain amino acid transport system substrate-binding protein
MTFNRRGSLRALIGACLATGCMALGSPLSLAAEPIRIGFGMALTGPLAPNGKSALLAMKIWENDINAKGGLLGRPVKLVYYDDKSSPSEVPAIYTKLLDVDHVDLIVGGYATMLAPAMPVVIQHNRLFIGILGIAVNSEFHYPKYFAMIPSGPDPKPAFTKGFFDVAMAQDPKPTTIAIVGADAEFSRNAADGARANAKAAGLKIAYNRTYPPATTDFGPIVRAIQATNPDLVVVCSYPLDSVGMVRAINEIGFKPKMIGGAMVGLQATVFKTQLGPLLNGIVNFDFWLPVKTMAFPGVMELISKYQALAPAEGVDLLGYYMAPFGYADLQVLGDAIQATQSLDDDKLADYIHGHSFKTVLGDISFGENGEWTQSRILQIQFQHIKGNGLDQFKDVSNQVIVSPDQYQTGKVIFPYEKAKE